MFINFRLKYFASAHRAVDGDLGRRTICLLISVRLSCSARLLSELHRWRGCFADRPLEVIKNVCRILLFPWSFSGSGCRCPRCLGAARMFSTWKTRLRLLKASKVLGIGSWSSCVWLLGTTGVSQPWARGIRPWSLGTSEVLRNVTCAGFRLFRASKKVWIWIRECSFRIVSVPKIFGDTVLGRARLWSGYSGWWMVIDGTGWSRSIRVRLGRTHSAVWSLWRFEDFGLKEILHRPLLCPQIAVGFGNPHRRAIDVDIGTGVAYRFFAENIRCTWAECFVRVCLVGPLSRGGWWVIPRRRDERLRFSGA